MNMRPMLILTAVVVLGAALIPVWAGQAVNEPGAFPVGTVDTLTLRDAERGSDVTVRVHYPEGEGPFPLIVFSHGLGAGKDAFGLVSRHWASHGYVVVHPQHDDQGVGMTGGGMHPPEQKIRERLRDVTAAMDALAQLEAGIPALRGRLDAGRIGVAGHSYGSFITMLAGGVTIEAGQAGNQSLADPRVRCIVPISPSGRGDYGLNDRGFDTLTMPAMFFTGTDDIRNGRAPDWRMEPYRLSPEGGKYLIVIADASHGSFGGDGPASDAPLYVMNATVAFWDSCLRGSRDGFEYLRDDDGFRAFAGDRATIEFR